MEPSKHSRISKTEADVHPLSEGELGIAASLFRRAVIHGQQKQLVASQSFLSALTSEMSSLPNDATGSMSDAAKRLREDDSPDKWAMLEFAEDGMLSPTTGLSYGSCGVHLRHHHYHHDHYHQVDLVLA